MSTHVLYHGIDCFLPDGIPLRSGPFSLLYEEGDLRYIKLGEYEVIRRVHVAVRDSIWRTISPRLGNLKLEVDADSFRITYDAENVEGEIDFAWQAEIFGTPSGTITFRMKGSARSNFRRNRIGFCVLHPMRECAGARCVVGHNDGFFRESTFPLLLSPHAPFVDMKSIAHEVAPGLWAKVQFEGDLFEMEDQRNWTDASFKTFCTPLSLPYPVEIEAGTQIEQTVTLTLSKERDTESPVVTGATQSLVLSENRHRSQNAVSVDINPLSKGQPIATIGLGMASHEQPLTDREVDRLRGLRLAHLRVDLRLSQPDWHVVLERAVSEVSRLGIRLEVSLFFSNEAKAELTGLLVALDALKPIVARWLIFHVGQDSTEEPWIVLARQSLMAYDESVPLGSGTNIHFTQLNRGRPPLSAVDVVCYSITPQAHAFDLRSLVETLEVQGTTVENSRQFVGQVPLAITPITLRPRFNQKLGADPEVAAGELPHAVDPRQCSLFGAVWTLGSLKYLNESGASSLTYYETTGWRGVMETQSGSLMPEKFRSVPGAVIPLYHVLADFGGFFGGRVVPCRSSDPLRVDAVVLTKEGLKEKTTRMMLGNMTEESQEVVVEAPVSPVKFKTLDETNAIAAITSCEAYRAREGRWLKAKDGMLRISLRPFAVARLDWS